MLSKVTTAVFPVAGLGTRFLPVTKAGPKEMLPIVDKPIIQYVVEEAIQAGITHLVFVTSSGKRAIEDYFDSNFELETRLRERENWRALKVVEEILPPHVSFSYIRQANPLGLGHAVLCAEKIIGDQPFAVLLADDIIDCGAQGCLQKMLHIYEQTKSSVLAVETVEPKDVSKYGIVALHETTTSHEIKAIVEKPSLENAPSRLAVTGRYILTPRIFSLLRTTQKGSGGEIQLTDGIAKLLLEEKVMAFPFPGVRYDCGSQLGFLQATFAFAMKRPELRESLHKFLAQELLTTAS